MRASDSNPAGLTGERLGIYQVESLIGSGGMGEVYRARDTRLGRAVAIKVLPPAFTSNASRVARFEREARLLASLNHPHIATVYGLEEFVARGGTERVFGLVMELSTDRRWPSGSGRPTPRLGPASAPGCRSTWRCRSPTRSPMRSMPRTSRASSIGISSRRTWR